MLSGLSGYIKGVKKAIGNMVLPPNSAFSNQIRGLLIKPHQLLGDWELVPAISKRLSSFLKVDQKVVLVNWQRWLCIRFSSSRCPNRWDFCSQENDLSGNLRVFNQTSFSKIESWKGPNRQKWNKLSSNVPEYINILCHLALPPWSPQPSEGFWYPRG